MCSSLLLKAFDIAVAWSLTYWITGLNQFWSLNYFVNIVTVDHSQQHSSIEARKMEIFYIIEVLYAALY